MDPLGEKVGLNFYEYAVNDPILWIDSLGLDIWVGSISWDPHQSINVGTPGDSNNFAAGFGVDLSNPVSFQNGIQGTIYEQDSNNPNSGLYLHTTPAQDAIAIQELQSLEGQTAPYRLLNSSCRDFAQAAFDFLKNQFKPPCQ